MLKDDLLEEFVKRIKTRLLLTDKLMIEVGYNLKNYSEEMFGEELALIVKDLPKRFDSIKVSIHAVELPE